MLPPYELAPVPKSETCPFCSGTQVSPWEFIPHVYVISLKSRPDRQAEAYPELHQQGLCVRTTMYLTEKADYPDPDKRGQYGIFMSHRQVCRIALEQDYDSILVLEDDFMFRTDSPVPNIPQQVEAAMLSLPIDWKRLNLGFVSVFGISYNKYVSRSLSLTTTAQIWSRDGCKHMDSLEYIQDGVDVQLMTLQKSFCIKPILIYQRGSKSDNALASQAAQEVLFQSPEGMQAATVWIPCAMALGALVLVALLFFPLKLISKNRWGWKPLIPICILVLIPFIVAIVWLACT